LKVGLRADQGIACQNRIGAELRTRMARR
jgi:hypothetical protein